MSNLKLGLYFNTLFLWTVVHAGSLDEVLKEHVYRNPKVKVSVENYKSSLYELEKSMANYKPSLDISTEIGKEHTEIDSSLSGAKDLNERQISIVGTYNLFDGFKSTHKFNEKHSAVEVAKSKVFQKVNQVSSFIIQVYLDVLRRKELLDIETKNFDNHLETLEKVKLRLQAGDGYESDFRQTQARVKLAEINKLMVEKQYRNATISYQKLMRTFPNIATMSAPTVNFTVNERKIEAFVAQAQKENVGIKIQRASTKVAKSVHAQERSKYYPTLDIKVSQVWNNNVHGFEGRDDSYKVALVMNYNLYNGGADRASELSALRKVHMSDGNLEDIKLSLEEEVRISLMKYQMLQRQLELLNQQLIYLQGTKELYELEYQNSKRTIIDVLNIKQEYAYAQTQKVNAHYDQLLAYYQFKNAMGTLVEEFNLEEVLDYHASTK